jgi:hypothetical protein
MLYSRMRTGLGLLGIGLLGTGLLLPPPARAQMWPNDSGPNGDALGSAVTQFSRLASPPIEAERVIPQAPVAQMPMEGYGDAGMPVVATPPAVVPRSPRRRVVRRDGRRNNYDSAPATRRARSTESELEQSLAERERRLDQLQRQVEGDRQRLQALRGSSPAPDLPATSSSSLFGITPAVAATVTPR